MKTKKVAKHQYRIHPQAGFNFQEIVIDNFAGGGGASTGIEAALGRPVDYAINHDPGAVAMHEINHPGTHHYCESVWDVDPVAVCQGRPVGLAWFSPDCKHFSKAKGKKPVEKKIRGLAWVVLKWAGKVRPRVIMLENVEEFITWGPLVTDTDGNCYPCPRRKGNTFRNFVKALRSLGYQVEWKEMRASDYGAPTIRKRLFLVARCDGQPIAWPEKTHGDPKSAAVKNKQLRPWRTAAECIDWQIPCPSIFERSKPLAEATLRRIAKGVMRYVVEATEPFIVTYYGDKSKEFRGQGLKDPLRTQTTENRFALVAPVLTECANASSPRCMPADEPLRTICAATKGGHHALVSTFLAKHYGGVVGSDCVDPLGTVTSIDHHSLVAASLVRHFGESVGSAATEPVGTITAGGMGKTGVVAATLLRNFGTSHAAPVDAPLLTVTGKSKDSLVTSHLVKLRGSCRDGQSVTDPLPTVTAGGTHVGEVRAFLMKYYGNEKEGIDLLGPLHTVTTRDRFGLVTVKGEQYQIVDLGMRMLAPRELFRAQGFPENYIIDRDARGKAITKTAQVARCGNSVCPPMAEALVRANMAASMERVAV
jgi:DNA (cytosine-5)-methyltransferase 1